MTFFDLLKMSLDNLLRRKLRTVLTVLGVIIGTASIVVMLSLGLGLKRTSLKQIEQYGGVTTVNVYAGEGQPDEEGKKKEEKRLDDKLVTQIAQIPHVELVSPVLQIDMIARFGKYQSAFSVKGMTGEALRKMNLKIGKGGLPPEDGTLQLFFGNQVQNNFYNPRGGNAAAPAIDFMREIRGKLLPVSEHTEPGSGRDRYRSRLRRQCKAGVPAQEISISGLRGLSRRSGGIQQ